MVLGGLGHAGEGRFEDQGPDLALRRKIYGNPRPERLAVQHEAVWRDPVPREKIERCRRIGIEARLARRARVPPIAAILQHQHAITVASKAPQARGAIPDMAAIAMEINDDRAALARWQVP